MSTRLSAGRVRSAYEFINRHRDQYTVDAMCRILEVAPSGYYDWLKQPLSKRGRGMFVNAGARDWLLRRERQKFLKEDWPQIHSTIQRLGLSAEDLLHPSRPVRQR